MRLLQLQLLGFRNLARVNLSPGPGFNVISGDNGQGKTNFLEAIYVLATLKSFRTPALREAITFGETVTRLSARFQTGDEGVVEERELQVDLSSAGKSCRLDGKAPSSFASYMSTLRVVLFAPEDLHLLRGAPPGRRRLLDRAVFTLRPEFLSAAQTYVRVLKARNAVLRQLAPDFDLLAVYDRQLVQHGTVMVDHRNRYLAALAPLFSDTFQLLTQTGAMAEIAYERSFVDLSEALSASRSHDLRRKRTTVGPHLDDVAFQIGGHSARVVASQGQTRALILAWKIAEIRLLMEQHGDAPVLLLDDVSSELDSLRNQQLFDFLRGIKCQCFVTTTHPRHVLAEENRMDFHAVRGAIQPQE